MAPGQKTDVVDDEHGGGGVGVASVWTSVVKVASRRAVTRARVMSAAVK